MLVETLNKTRSLINCELIEEISKKFLEDKKLNNAEVSIVIIGDVLMRRLNNSYRKKDKPTDVLSFRSSDSQMIKDDYLGELFINYAQIKRQAGIYGNSPETEFIFILIHGLLHLIGYNDETEAEALEMDKLGREFIEKYKIVYAKI